MQSFGHAVGSAAQRQAMRDGQDHRAHTVSGRGSWREATGRGLIHVGALAGEGPAMTGRRSQRASRHGKRRGRPCKGNAAKQSYEV